MGARIRVIWHTVVQACGGTWARNRAATDGRAALLAAQEDEEARSLAWVMQLHDPKNVRQRKAQRRE
ncbi:hypothetical protein D3C77_05320 [compost metagenome]|uniref:hypothetical protein n=1 Tax=Pseudomonas TaxID=286 RepID=UPI00041E6DE8|nr:MULTISPECIES: hypothetical protein [Pseudomonas]PRA56815.1 hypothetical protein CQ065_25000 [Pseudomonas sp. MYb187]